MLFCYGYELANRCFDEIMLAYKICVMKFGETLYARNSESLENIPSDELLSLVRPKTEQAISFGGLKALKLNMPVNILSYWQIKMSGTM